MNIGYFADGPWSHEAIKLISETVGMNISFIVPRYDTQDPVLKEWAEKLNVPYILCQNVNSSEFICDIEKYNADLFISMSFNQILKKEIISFPKLGFINCHAGALPFYRGRNPLNWALINGESSFGITVHYVDEGIDTGDIIEQRLYPITLTDDYSTLLKRAINECANVLHAATLKIFSNNVQVIKQNEIHPVGTYFGMRTFGDEIIDFNWSAMRFYNFVRAINSPGPLARCYIDDNEYGLIACELIENSPAYIATIGEVIGRTPKGVVVKVGDSSIMLTLMSNIKNGHLLSEFIPKFKIGTRFKLNNK
jgi:methionyl-tRNA formyltransferase